VLSGHDHDQCTVVHSTPFGPVTEVRESQLSVVLCSLFPPNGTFNATAYPWDDKLAARKSLFIFYAVIHWVQAVTKFN
jgi:hypothetical protein